MSFSLCVDNIGVYIINAVHSFKSGLRKGDFLPIFTNTYKPLINMGSAAFSYAAVDHDYRTTG